MRKFLGALSVLAGGLLLGAVTRTTEPAAGAASVVQLPRLTSTATDGFAVKSYRTAFGLTQDSLSKLTSRFLSATQISRIERALDATTAAQRDSLYAAIYRVWQRCCDTMVVHRLAASHRRVFPAPPIVVQPPAPPSPVFPAYAITAQRATTSGGLAVYLVVAPGHAILHRTKVALAGHSAVVDGLPLWARVRFDSVLLYRDSALLAPVVVSPFGAGGTISNRP